MAYKVILAILFYLNTYYLYPVIYRQRGMLVYVVTVIASIAILYFLSDLISELVDKMDFDKFEREVHEGKGPGGPGGPRGGRRGPRGPGPDSGMFIWIWWKIGELWFRLLPYFFVVCSSFIYRLQLDNSIQSKIRKEKENENLKTELSFLRSQVSPHFIFNILNNMVSLARKKSDLLEPSLIQLSNLMRYMLYENDDEKVTLDKEISYLKSYINLQLLRFGDDVTITFNPPENTGGITIEPMLLAPFVENAFKHGVGMVENPQINILLTINEQTGWLDFKVMNTIAPQQDSKDKSSGIGLVNVRRRLELLYKDNFNMDIMQTGSVFVADLKIKLA
ncbi:histidine kinase [Pedobacter sp. HMF7056]|uniref:Histidine kinase n=2 Tax=Hufsiella ginkgonis TaxID=2695274 RepID=A0A7K1XVY9_9SPHI|nr:histidine kinase [Hufsiella ginkgonis]